MAAEDADRDALVGAPRRLNALMIFVQFEDGERPAEVRILGEIGERADRS